MNLSEFESLVRKRSSVRAFDSEHEVTDDVIRSILDVARLAPSAANSQPWEFVIIRDAALREAIVAAFREQLAEKGDMEAIVGRPVGRIGSTGFRRAPLFVLLIADSRTTVSYPVRTLVEKGNEHLVASMAIVSAYLHLAVAASGLGSQHVSDVSSFALRQYLHDLLSIPPYMKIYELIPIGKPAAAPRAKPRRCLDELLHADGYDHRKQRDASTLATFIASQTRAGRYRKAASLDATTATDKEVATNVDC